MKRFTRKIENFKCRNCGFEAIGTGYTNHCPNCLWSRHVDTSPGDRAEICGGMMEPIGVEIKGGGKRIIHKCEACGAMRKNKSASEDDNEAIFRLIEAN